MKCSFCFGQTSMQEETFVHLSATGGLHGTLGVFFLLCASSKSPGGWGWEARVITLVT